MKNKRPKGVIFIGCFYIFGAFALFISLISSVEQDVSIGLRFGLPSISDHIIIPIVIVLSLAIAYGYLKLSKWGYWLMMLYSVVFLFISLALSIQYNSQPFTGNTIWSIIVLIYTYGKRNYFHCSNGI